MSTLAPRFLLGFTALTAATSCSLVIDTWQEKAVRTDVLEHQADDAFNLRIDGFNGDITVTTAPGVRALTGEATVYARGATQDSADSRLGQMAWSWERDGDTLVLNLSKPSGGSNNAGSTIDNLLVPEGWNVDIHSSNGNISVGAGFARVMVHPPNASIEPTGNGQVRLKSSNGRIRYSGSSDDFNLDTSNGRIELNLMGDWSGNGMVDTSNATIDLRCTGVIMAALEADTSNGKTNIEGPPLGSGGRLVLDTSNGNINITHGDG